MLPLRTILHETPLPFARFYDLPGSGNPSVSLKNWASAYPEVQHQCFTLHFNLSLDEIHDHLGPENEMDQFLLSKSVYPLNRLQEELQNVGDSVRAFYTHISFPVQLALQGTMVQRSQAGPPGPTNHRETADFVWIRGDHCVVVGGLKRHGIIKQTSWENLLLDDANRTNLSKELRGYCHKYRTAAGVLFDGRYLLILLFQASAEQDLEAVDCPVKSFLFAHTNPNLRYALFRIASLQVQRCQAQTAPPLHLDGYTRLFAWWSGAPYWTDASGRTFPHHPHGYTRHFDRTNGAWYWHTPHGRVQDTAPLW
ncbi:hypothetical protein F4678DRAFT_484569 [Xylaria arbuscula]|nr:hypothetical protein F4678DRAFT_484569 [Xylaria arbuscula]